MALGKMNAFITLVSNEPVKDNEGFTVSNDKPLASIRAYKEMKHGSEVWKNRAAFSTAGCLFRFRKIPGLTVTTAMSIVCDGERYNIVSAEDVKGRGMYVEVLAERVQGSEG